MSARWYHSQRDGLNIVVLFYTRYTTAHSEHVCSCVQKSHRYYHRCAENARLADEVGIGIRVDILQTHYMRTIACVDIKCNNSISNWAAHYIINDYIDISAYFEVRPLLYPIYCISLNS